MRIRLILLLPGLLLSTGMLMILPWRYLIVLISGLMVGREDFSSIGVLKLLVLAFTFLLLSVAFHHSVWGTVEEYGDARLERCRAFLPVPGVLQTVQRAEFWGAIVALQAYWSCHLGIDNLNVVRSIGRLLDADCSAKPLPLVNDGDLVALVQIFDSYSGL